MAQARFVLRGRLAGQDLGNRRGLRLEIRGPGASASMGVASSIDGSGRFIVELAPAEVERAFRVPVGVGVGTISRGDRVNLEVRALRDEALVGYAELSVDLSSLMKDTELELDFGPRPGTVVLPAYSVQGRVLQADGRLVTNAVVQVWHYGPVESTLLTQDSNTTDGVFSVQYRYGTIFDPAGPGIPIEVVATAGSRSDVIARSGMVCKPPTALQIDLVRDRATLRGPSLYDAIARVARPLLGAGNAAEYGDRAIEYLHCTTAFELQTITAFVAGLRFEAQTRVSAQAFFAFIQQGTPARLEALAAIPVREIEPRLATAVRDNVIAAARDPRVPVQQFTNWVVSYNADASRDGSLGQLLQMVQLSSVLPAEFVRQFVSREASLPEFWEGFVARAAPEDIAAVDFVLTAGSLTGHVPLVQRLVTERQSGGIASLRQLARRDEAQWQATLESAEIDPPPFVLGESLTERRTLYAKALSRAFEASYPTVAMVSRVASRGRLTLAAQYVDAHPEFDYRGVRPAKFLQDNPPPPGIDPAALRQELELGKRLFQIAPRIGKAEVVDGLMNAGISSAYELASLDLEKVEHRYGATLGGVATETIWQSARRVAMLSLHVAVGLHQSRSPYGLAGDLRLPPDPNDPPDLRELFGSIDYCVCPHCRSVLGPAAYLTFILQFLEKNSASGAFPVLRARRPEIEHIRLDCKNAETPLPTIDLVNEILEREVVRREDGNSAAAAIRWPQTTWSERELRAHPEHLIGRAYEILAEREFPWTLPFDLRLAEARGYLDRVGLRFGEMLDELGAQPQTVAIVAARLGVPRRAVEILIEAQPGAALARYWGAASLPNLMSVVRDAETFLQRSGLTVLQYEELRRLSWLTGSPSLSYPTPCDLGDATMSGWTEALLSRWHRFLRLMGALGWSGFEVSHALAVFGPAADPLDLGTIAALADFVELERRFSSVSRLELVSWFGPLPEIGAEPDALSLFEALFIEPGAAADENPLSSLPVELDLVRPEVAAALRISQGDLDALRTLETFASADVATLSRLFALASLVRALGSSVKELVEFGGLTGLHPLGGAWPTATGAEAAQSLRRFLRVWDRHQTAASVAELRFALQHVGREHADDEIALVVLDLGRGLQALARQLEPLRDSAAPVDARLQQALNALLPPVRVSALLETIRQPPGAAPALPDDIAGWMPAELWATLHSPLPSDEAVGPRMQATLDVVSRFIELHRARAAVVQRLAEFGEISTALTSVLAETLPASTDSRMLAFLIGRELGLASAFDFETDAASLSAPGLAARWRTEDPLTLGLVLDLLHRFAKAAWVTRQLALDEGWLRWLLDVGAEHGLLDLATLPVVSSPTQTQRFAAWDKTLRLRILDRGVFRNRLREVYALLPASPSNAVPSGAWVEALANAAQWPSAVVAGVVERLGSTEARLHAVDGLEQIVYAFAQAERIGISADRLIGWVEASQSGVTLQVAREIKAAVQSRFPAERWPSIVGELRDALREQQRDALVAEILATSSDPAETKPDHLLRRFLIDVQGAACQRTSRIVQATLAVQLLVQRGLMNLEDDAEFSASAARRWQWMKNYRVWQANREIFLYPENYLDPDWREDKSPIFETFVQSVQQSELQPADAERAFVKYAEALHEVSDLRVGGIHYQAGEDAEYSPEQGTLHVFAHTHGNPPKYFYRTHELGQWSPWEEVPGKLPSGGVVPVVRNGRLHAFWPTIEPKGQQLAGEDEARKYADVRLTWIERTHDGWQPERQSDVVSSSRPIALQTSRVSRAETEQLALTERYSLHPWVEGSALHLEPVVHLRRSNGIDQYSVAFPLAWFSTGGCGGEFGLNPRELVPRVSYPRYISPRADERRGQYLVVNHPLNTLPVAQRDLQYFGNRPEQTIYAEGMTVPVFRRGPDTFAVAPSVIATQFGAEYVSDRTRVHFAADRPFAFRDTRRSFVVWPRSPGFLVAWWAWQPTQGPTRVPTGGVIGGGAGRIDDFFTPPRHTHMMPVDPPDGGSDPGLPGGNPQPPDRPAPQVPSTGYVNLLLLPEGLPQIESTLRYEFELFIHPFACLVLDRLRRFGIDGVLAATSPPLFRQLAEGEVDYEPSYAPDADQVHGEFPFNEFDFSPGGAYSLYNWEFFVHAPMFMADALRAQGRFADAQRWMHYVFNPQEPSSGQGAQRYWRVKPFYEEGRPATIEALLRALAGDPSADPKLANKVQEQISTWIDRPFQPHAIAGLRPGAYQKWVVMRYLDMLIEWGDRLFQQDTLESINEALQIYILAAQLLGDPPRELPERATDARSYAELREDLDAFGNAFIPIENNVDVVDFTPFDRFTVNPAPVNTIRPVNIPAVAFASNQRATAVGEVAEVHGGMTRFAITTQPPEPEPPLQGFVALDLLLDIFARRELYFCIPPNRELSKYWDIVGDRLYKIRHCLNIEGAYRELSLFAPRIDPALLAQAAAAGLDIATAMADLSAPVPLYRFEATLAFAKEIVADVRNFGAALLSALQSGDAEKLAELRAVHEVALLDQIRRVKELRIEESTTTVTALERARDVLVHRRDEYANRVRRLEVEQDQYDKLADVESLHEQAAGFNLMASVLGLIPDFGVGFAGLGPLASASFGGQFFSSIYAAIASQMNATAAALNSGAAVDAFRAAELRRNEDWDFQKLQADKEITRIDRDILAARIREQISTREVEDHHVQRQQAKTIEDYLGQRYTQSELFRWLSKELQQTYHQAYQLAFDLAKRAERCYQFELHAPTAKFIQFGHWDNRRKGLLAGDKLMHDLRRLESAYRENNRREYELVKRISLAMIDPFSLQQLRETGRCTIRVDEALLDLDHPSHYMRRLKAVRFSMPAVTGPYTPVTGTLTLATSTIRVEPDRNIEPQAAPGGGQTQIALSHGQADAGLFEANLRDERYLPFEGKGAVSTWALELPDHRQFDYRTISDVVLELQYTAREGGLVLRNQVRTSLQQRLGERPLGTDFGVGPMRLWSLKDVFPAAWGQLVAEGRFDFEIGAARLPHPVDADGQVRIRSLDLLLIGPNLAGVSITITPPEEEPTTHDAAAIAPWGFGVSTGALTPEVSGDGTWTVAVDDEALDAVRQLADVFVLVGLTVGGA